MFHTLAAELPPARTQPIEWSAPALAAMSRAERRLAEELIGADEALFAARTDSRVDVGSWLGPGRLWAFALRHELVLAAHGPRPYTERIPYSRIRESAYNPVTGELVLAPPVSHLYFAHGRYVPNKDATPHARGLRVPPLEGYQLLAQIHGKEGRDAPATD